MRLIFLGANGTVTGSRTLVEYGRSKVLVDCGLFQGLKNLRLKNWAPFPVPPSSIDALILTHAHLDHSGYIPRLVREGFFGPIYCTPATRDLCRILWSDYAVLMEEEAHRARRHGYSKHQNPEPLFTVEDALKASRHFRTVAWHDIHTAREGLEITFHKAGHILGASLVHLKHEQVSITFSGDLGRMEDPLFHPPESLPASDFLVLESTYGNRKHVATDTPAQLSDILKTAAERQGVVLIPAFAVGRTQSVLHHLWQLKKSGKAPKLPVFVDSPMATNVTQLYLKHSGDHGLEPGECENVFGIAHYVESVEESKRLSARKGSMVLISASGMATGGRILHHLKAFAPNPDNTIVLAGFQAAGTRGALLESGADSVKIHGQYISVQAQVKSLENSSAHADADEMVAWLRRAKAAPRTVFINHGESAASDALRQRLMREFGWVCRVPEPGEAAALES